MNPVVRGLAVGLLQIGLLLTVGGKYLLDRATLPRQWVEVTPVDPDNLLRGRYLLLEVKGAPKRDRFDFFVPEHSSLARPLKPNEHLWAEVTRLPDGLRPIRLAIRSAP